MSEPVSLSVRPDRCAILTPWSMGRGGYNCERPPTVHEVWRFEPPDGRKRVLLCDRHAVELDGHERLSRRTA